MTREEWEKARIELREQRRALRRARSGVGGPLNVGPHHFGGGAMIGGIFVVFGVLLLCQNLGLLRMRDVWSYWPVAPMIWGALTIARGRSVFSYVIGGLAVTLGSLKLADNLGFLDMSPKLFGPIILIGLGVAFLARNLMDPPEILNAAGVSSENRVSEARVFSGTKRRIETDQFEGGDIHAVFGGVDIDLRKSKMKGPTATIEMNAVFGGIHLKIPETWAVEMRCIGVFGGHDDKTIPPRPEAGPAPRLIITGNAVFGGVEIEN